MCFLPSAEGQNKDFCKRVLKAATRQNDEAESDQSSGTDEKDEFSTYRLMVSSTGTVEVVEA